MKSWNTSQITFTNSMMREMTQLKSADPRVSLSWSFIGSRSIRFWISHLCKTMKAAISQQRKPQLPNQPLRAHCWGCSNRWAQKARKLKGRGRAKVRRGTYRNGIEATFEIWVRMVKLIPLCVLNHRKNFKWLITLLNHYSHLERT